MKQRIISGAVLTVIAVIVSLLGGYLLAFVTFVLSVIAYRELLNAIGLSGNKARDEYRLKLIKGITGVEAIGYLGIIAYYCVMLISGNATGLFLAVFGILIAFLALYVFSFPKYEARQIMSAFFCLIYGPMMLTFIYLIRNLDYGIYLIWMVFICSWLSDTFAYFSGVCFGKHKLAPVLSPKKTIEGSIGGIFGSALVGLLYGLLVVEKQMTDMHIAWILVIIAAIGAIISQIGDLAASGIKRNEGIKDYGRLIPGHGGIMDRFDSVIIVAPIIYLLCIVFV